ncbi:hypothetical protein [Sphingomonas morindae]|uniref:Uncharacterized protein n=1 Tax=Sphingomonas morindae TaxID=1541170 RepID=A0ABY4X439_9SPHN|nr:hypothetical protein [Sphingomonas morindae]USI71612.1 hypothetical protein LHA26_09710 [Sphingomonas morindae]
MPALPSDIAAAIRDVAIAQWSAQPVKDRYPSARDGVTDTSEGFFDTLIDALQAIAARGALIGTERRRFSVVVQDLVWLDPSQGAPTIDLHDAEQGAVTTFVVARIELDLEAETTTLEVFG